jgi:hypothetical protein
MTLADIVLLGGFAIVAQMFYFAENVQGGENVWEQNQLEVKLGALLFIRIMLEMNLKWCMLY